MSIDVKAGIAYGYKLTIDELLKVSSHNAIKYNEEEWDKIVDNYIDDYVINTSTNERSNDFLLACKIEECNISGCEEFNQDLEPDLLDLKTVADIYIKYFEPVIGEKEMKYYLYLSAF